jgi:hypothetical protein
MVGNGAIGVLWRSFFYTALLGCSAQLPPRLAEADLMLFDFESGSWDGWTVDEQTFGSAPVSAAEVASWGDRAPHGMQGRYMVATAKARHDRHPAGRMVSSDFLISRRYLTFLLAGELNPRVRVVLEVEGEVVRAAYGNNAYDLMRRGWDVTELRGGAARLVIEDMAGPASLLRVDDFRLSNNRPPEVGSFEVPRRQESELVRAGEFRLLLDSSDLGEGQAIFHHSLVRGHDGRWHLFGAVGAEADRYRTERVRELMHASADRLQGPWSSHGVVLRASAPEGERFINDPHVVFHDGRYHLFFLGSGSGFPGWTPGVCHWESGRFTASEGCAHGPFSIHLATSSDGGSWTRHGVVVTDGPFAAGPTVRRVGEQWVMYYGSAEPAQPMGKHAIVYRTSSDLLQWSTQRGIAMLDTSSVTPWPEHPFIRDPIVVQRGDSWHLFAGPINNDNLSRYHVLWPFTSGDPYSWTHGRTPPHGRLFVDGGAEILRDEGGRWWVTTGNVLSGGVWLAPLYWNDARPAIASSEGCSARRGGRTSSRC